MTTLSDENKTTWIHTKSRWFFLAEKEGFELSRACEAGCKLVRVVLAPQAFPGFRAKGRAALCGGLGVRLGVKHGRDGSMSRAAACPIDIKRILFCSYLAVKLRLMGY